MAQPPVNSTVNDINIDTVLSKLNNLQLCVGYDGPSSDLKINDDNKPKKKYRKQKDILVDYSIFTNIDLDLKIKVITQYSNNSLSIDRSIGCAVGMGIGDAVGAPLEFQPIDHSNNNRPCFILNEHKYINPNNKFRLKPGQWTDDAAMGLCIADSLLLNNGKFIGSDIRIRFWNWWYNGYNNSFRNDRNIRGNKDYAKTNNLTFLGLTSIGLGRNISESLTKLKPNIKPTDIYTPKIDSEDSGNGSLIRLAPIPILYHNNVGNALKYAELSSLTTHPGYPASESSKLLCYVILNGIQRNKDQYASIKVFLESITIKYKTDILEPAINGIKIKIQADKDDNKDNNDDDLNVLGISKNKLKRELNAKLLIKKLIESNEPITSKEVCWNWKSNLGELKLLTAMDSRKWGYNQENKESDDDYPDLYNNYPVESGYFGSYCMDGLAMALHSVYNSTSFGSAVEIAVNLLGDADSTGSIAGQIAGAYYGYKSIINDTNGKRLMQDLVKWDNYQFALSAVLLYSIGNKQ